jgi:hypothetical protein
MQLFDILFVLALGGWNFSNFRALQYIKSIKSVYNNADKERRNSALPVIKFRF